MDNTTVTTSPSVRILENNTLFIRESSVDHSGQYECEVTTEDAEVYEDRLDIVVEPAPVLVIPAECQDSPLLAKCHLVVLSRICSKSQDVAR